jgi:hypothetical protein
MFIFGLKMEDIFIKKIIGNEKGIHEFDFNSFWIANDSPNKKIAVRKIKVYREPITCFASFYINDSHQINVGEYNLRLAYTVNDNHNIVDFLNYLTEGINKKLDRIFKIQDLCLKLYLQII